MNLKLKAVKKTTRYIKASKKASQKLHALAIIASYMDFEKRRSLMKTFLILLFNYFPLIWMFDSRVLNNRISRMHERALRLVY